MSNPFQETGIPILTEVIITPADGVHTVIEKLPKTEARGPSPWNEGKFAPKAVEKPQAKPDHRAPEAAPTGNLSTEEWAALEHRIGERVLRQLQGRVEFVLEQRVRDSLSDVLQSALEGLTAEIKRGLQETLEEVISRAVTQEITRLRALKK